MTHVSRRRTALPRTQGTSVMPDPSFSSATRTAGSEAPSNGVVAEPRKRYSSAHCALPRAAWHAVSDFLWDRVRQAANRRTLRAGRSHDNWQRLQRAAKSDAASARKPRHRRQRIRAEWAPIPAWTDRCRRWVLASPNWPVARIRASRPTTGLVPLVSRPKAPRLGQCQRDVALQLTPR